MKTKEEIDAMAKDYVERNFQTNWIDLYCAFLAGYTAANQWVPVGERLPEPDVSVLGWFEFGFDIAIRFNDVLLDSQCAYEASHWKIIEPPTN